jgi:hypothetical protein
MERRRGDLEGMADEAIERTLRRLRIPTRHDIDRINERLDRLTAQLKKQTGAGSATRRKPR